MKLGKWPTDKYYISWMTQRLVNKAPELSHARRAPASQAKQLLNPIGQELQSTIQGITEERHNMFISSADVSMMDVLFKVNLKPSLSFNFTQNEDGSETYDIPKVYINDGVDELTQAEFNNIESFWYDALPSRIEDGELSYVYSPIIPETLISDLGSVSPNDVLIEGHLHLTISNNTNWQYKRGTEIFYSKVYINGVTRKGTTVTEAVPIRYNGTFKTINQWKTVNEVYVDYLSEDALITIESIPFSQNGHLDHRNLNVTVEGDERWRFLKTNRHSWGDSLFSESYTSANFDIIRQGIEARDIEYELELLDDSSQNVTIDSYTFKPNTDYMFAIGGNKFYVYNTQCPYPDVTRIAGESPDVKMDLYADKWIFARDEEATIRTRLLDFSNVPYRTRWSIETPSLDTYFLGLDGSFWPTTTEAWVDNIGWDGDEWEEIRITFPLSECGTYIVTLESMYINEDTNETKTMSTKYLFFVPTIQPEIELSMPLSISDTSSLGFDSDGLLWAIKDGDILSLKTYYDYFIADYSNNTIWLREEYSSVKVEV
jgi:hypothetical protein